MRGLCRFWSQCMGRLTTLKHRIPTMHKPSQGWSDERRGSSTERGYGAEWRRARAETIREQAGICQPCLRRGHVTPGCTTVDHVMPKARGGGDGAANRQCICDPCHKAKTAAESRGLEWDEAMPIARPGSI